MKANELRIGNFIKINNEVIEGIGYGVIMDLAQINKGLTNDYLKSLKHEPIQLTEEWLLKLGFLQCRENTAGKTYAIFINGIRFDDTMIVLWSSTGLFWRKNMVMESVHQVQNLYFGLTGQELEFVDGESFLK